MSQQNQYILVKGSSGLGNRILALSTALWYSRITKRKIIVDWQDGSYGDGKRNVFFHYFDCPIALDLDILQSNLSIYPPIWQNNLAKTFGGLKHILNLSESQMSCDISQVNYLEDMVVFCSYTHKTGKIKKFLTGDFADFSKLDTRGIIKAILGTELQLKANIQAEVDKFAQQHFTGSVLGVHVRYTDMKVDLDKIHRQVGKILAKNQPYIIFLATDSQKVKEDFLARYPRVITTDKWFPESGTRLHQNWSECSDRLRNGQEALIDLYLLARCDHLIYSSQSSFGYLASIISNQPMHQLYDIEKVSGLVRMLSKVTRRKLW